MKFRIIKIGKFAFPEYRELVTVYQQRLHSNYRAEFLQWRDEDQQAIGRNWENLLSQKNKLSSRAFIGCLDQVGKTMSTESITKTIQNWRDDRAIEHVTFVVGGPFGIKEEYRRSCDFIWSLSELTLTSDLAHLILWEQLFRAHSILSGLPYHHE